MFWTALALLGLAWATPDAARPIASVERNVVAYPVPPRLRVRVPANATYLGSDRFILNGSNDCEMHIFVEADADRRVRRYYWVHFESILPSRPDDRMHYDTDRRSQRWGSTIWIRATPAQTSRTPRPGSDTEHFRAIIRNAGYTLPASMMAVRLVRLPDDPKGTGYGRQELMLVYGEDAAPSGLGFDDMTTNGEPNSRWKTLEEPLVDRAFKSFHVAAR